MTIFYPHYVFCPFPFCASPILYREPSSFQFSPFPIHFGLCLIHSSWQTILHFIYMVTTAFIINMVEQDIKMKTKPYKNFK